MMMQISKRMKEVVRNSDMPKADLWDELATDLSTGALHCLVDKPVDNNGSSNAAGRGSGSGIGSDGVVLTAGSAASVPEYLRPQGELLQAARHLHESMEDLTVAEHGAGQGVGQGVGQQGTGQRVQGQGKAGNGGGGGGGGGGVWNCGVCGEARIPIHINTCPTCMVVYEIERAKVIV
jgi:hypothetical protein